MLHLNKLRIVIPMKVKTQLNFRQNSIIFPMSV